MWWCCNFLLSKGHVISSCRNQNYVTVFTDRYISLFFGVAVCEQIKIQFCTLLSVLEPIKQFKVQFISFFFRTTEKCVTFFEFPAVVTQ